MTRPVSTSKTRRVQVQSDLSQPDLSVVAPTDIRPIQSQGAQKWAALTDALSAAAPIAARHKAALEDHDYKQGIADAELGQADGNRISESQRYADGVYNVRTLSRWQEVSAEIAQRAVSELDQTLPVDQKVAIIDGWFAKEMGDVLGDAKARMIVAPRYEEFINRYANAEVQQQLTENAQFAVDTIATDINEGLASGSFGSYEEQHARLSQVVGRSQATAELIGIILNRAESVASTGGDAESVYNLIPASIKTEDGQTIAGPRNTPRYNDLINASKARAGKLRNDFLGPERAFREFQVRNGFEQRILKGDVIATSELQSYVQDGTLSPETASSINIRSMEAHNKAAKESNEWALQKSVLYATGGLSWLDVVGLENGPKNREEAQKLTDKSLAEYIQAASRVEGVSPVFDGPGMLEQGPGGLAFNVAVQASRDMRLPYTPLKSFLSQVTPAQPEGLLKRLPLYEVLKRENLTGMYFDDDAVALYESVLTMQRGGEKPENIAQSVSRINDASTQAYVRQERTVAQKKLMSGEFDVVNSFWDASAKEISNKPYLRARMAALTELFVSRGMPANEAIEAAKLRFNDTHFAVKLNDKVLVLPESPSHSSAELAAALEWMSGAAKVFAEHQGVPDPGSARLTIDIGINGNGPEVFFVDSTGERLNTRPFTFEAMLKNYRTKMSPDARKEAEELFRNRRRSWEAQKRINETLLKYPATSLQPGLR